MIEIPYSIMFGGTTRVARQWGKELSDDLQLTNLIRMGDELELIELEILLRLHLHHLRKAKELIRGYEGCRRRIQ